MASRWAKTKPPFYFGWGDSSTVIFTNESAVLPQEEPEKVVAFGPAPDPRGGVAFVMLDEDVAASRQVQRENGKRPAADATNRPRHGLPDVAQSTWPHLVGGGTDEDLWHVDHPTFLRRSGPRPHGKCPLCDEHDAFTVHLGKRTCSAAVALGQRVSGIKLDRRQSRTVGRPQSLWRRRP